jgi:hypothetical protein
MQLKTCNNQPKKRDTIVDMLPSKAAATKKTKSELLGALNRAKI